MLSEAILKQAVEELAIALIESLQAPEQYQHQFSNEFDCNMELSFLQMMTNVQKDDIEKNLDV